MENSLVTVNTAIAEAVQRIFTNLNNLTRWPQLTADKRYNQLNKMGLSMFICLCIACILEKHGILVNWTQFPKLAIYQAVQKSVIANTPQSQFKWLKENANIDNVAEHAIRKSYSEIPEEIWKFLETGESIEKDIFRLSGKLASKMELEELTAITGTTHRYWNAMSSKLDEINEFKELISIIKADWMQTEPIIKEISLGLRNQYRWIFYCRAVECSVLGHLFETGVMAYIMSIENGNSERVATRHFFMGIFHDIAETWTVDMPSPLKDAKPGLRKAIADFEAYMLETKMYKELPIYLATMLKSLDFESEINKADFTLIKGADYVSASLECLRQYWGGSRDPRFGKGVQDIQKMVDNREIYVSTIGKRIIDNSTSLLNNN